MAKILCANPDCKIEFEPTRRDQKYHSPTCRMAAANQRLPPKRVRKDEIRYLYTRRKRQEAKSDHVTWCPPPTGANPFRRLVLAERKAMQIRQECELEMAKMGFFGPLGAALPAGDPQEWEPNRQYGVGEAVCGGLDSELSIQNSENLATDSADCTDQREKAEVDARIPCPVSRIPAFPPRVPLLVRLWRRIAAWLLKPWHLTPGT